jgi:hypothetical protein
MGIPLRYIPTGVGPERRRSAPPGGEAEYGSFAA